MSNIDIKNDELLNGIGGGLSGRSETKKSTGRKRYQSLQLSSQTRFLTVLASIGASGLIVFGYLMERSLAPAREATRGNFSTFGDTLIIPAFLCFGALSFFAFHGLYRAYRAVNDPNTYHGEERRRRNRQRTSG